MWISKDFNWDLSWQINWNCSGENDSHVHISPTFTHIQCVCVLEWMTRLKCLLGCQKMLSEEKRLLLPRIGVSISLSLILTSCCCGQRISLLRWWRLWPPRLQWCRLWLPSCTFLQTKVIEVRYEDMRLNWEHYLVFGEEIWFRRGKILINWFCFLCRNKLTL